MPVEEMLPDEADPRGTFHLTPFDPAVHDEPWTVYESVPDGLDHRGVGRTAREALVNAGYDLDYHKGLSVASRRAADDLEKLVEDYDD